MGKLAGALSPTSSWVRSEKIGQRFAMEIAAA